MPITRLHNCQFYIRSQQNLKVQTNRKKIIKTIVKLKFRYYLYDPFDNAFL